MADQFSDIQLSDLLGGDEQTAQQRAASMAAALRQQQAQAQQQQFLGGLGSVFGAERAGPGNAYAKLGAENYAQAQNQLEQIPKTLEVRLQRALEKQRADQQAKYQEGELGLREQQLEQGKFAPMAPGGQIYNTRTGELGPVGDVSRPAPQPRVAKGAGPPTLASFDKLAAPLRSEIDPSSGRGQGLFGKDQAIVTSADKVLALVDDGKGGRNYNLTVRQFPELVQSVTSALGGGNASAQAQIEHLMPKTWGSSRAEKLEYLLGHPEDAHLAEFAKQYAETMDREKKLALERIRDVQLRRLSAHPGLFSQFPKETTALVRQYRPELTDEDVAAGFGGTYKPKAAGGSDREAKIQELKALRAKMAAGAPGAGP